MILSLTKYQKELLLSFIDRFSDVYINYVSNTSGDPELYTTGMKLDHLKFQMIRAKLVGDKELTKELTEQYGRL